MNVLKTNIEGVLILEPTRYGDQRGYFMESFSARDFEQAVGYSVNFVQDNESLSAKGVLRGLHFQREPYAQAKLVRVVRGRVLDVAVDIRKGSPTYGGYVAVELSGENGRQLFIPKGFAHGFLALEEGTVFQYKCDEYYHPESEDGIAWNDPEVAIDWGVGEEEVVLSEKDRNRLKLKEVCEF
ncbi:MAG: dTDP-4-dehydrorhamnose 3,5-epimerase [Tidjanibacter sp.]|nr:dTDP-4-dehydrorhamnose 3,5-epimerase [Tidjanibacter sp.]